MKYIAFIPFLALGIASIVLSNKTKSIIPLLITMLIVALLWSIVLTLLSLN